MTHDKPETFPVLYDAARKTAYYFNRNEIRAVNLDSGKDVWRSELDWFPTDDLESLWEEAELFEQGNGHLYIVDRIRIAQYAKDNGTYMWDTSLGQMISGPLELRVTDNTVALFSQDLVERVGLDVKTGEQVYCSDDLVTMREPKWG